MLTHVAMLWTFSKCGGKAEDVTVETTPVNPVAPVTTTREPDKYVEESATEVEEVGAAPEQPAVSLDEQRLNKVKEVFSFMDMDAGTLHSRGIVACVSPSLLNRGQHINPRDDQIRKAFCICVYFLLMH